MIVSSVYPGRQSVLNCVKSRERFLVELNCKSIREFFDTRGRMDAMKHWKRRWAYSHRYRAEYGSNGMA